MYSVFDPNGQKIADCGILRDAVNLVGTRNKYWDGHYYQFRPTYQSIDVEPFPQNQLPTKDIVVNMDGGIGGSWKEVEYVTIEGQKIPIQQLSPNNEPPLEL